MSTVNYDLLHLASKMKAEMLKAYGIPKHLMKSGMNEKEKTKTAESAISIEHVHATRSSIEKG